MRAEASHQRRNFMSQGKIDLLIVRVVPSLEKKNTIAE
jgi:hypothetical protein